MEQSWADQACSRGVSIGVQKHSTGRDREGRKEKKCCCRGKPGRLPRQLSCWCCWQLEVSDAAWSSLSPAGSSWIQTSTPTTSLLFFISLSSTDQNSNWRSEHVTYVLFWHACFSSFLPLFVPSRWLCFPFHPKSSQLYHFRPLTRNSVFED